MLAGRTGAKRERARAEALLLVGEGAGIPLGPS